MIDIKLIRNNPNIIKDMLKKRNTEFPLQQLLKLDEQLREKKSISQSLSAERNQLAKEIGKLKSSNQDCTELLEKVSKTKALEEDLVQATKVLEEQFKDIILMLPNIPLEDVPSGVDENDNKEIRKVGNKREFNFEPKEHFILGENLKMMDFNKAIDMAGSRFVILKKDLSHLERALYNFMLDTHTQKHGYEENSLPVLLKEEMLVNTAQLPKFSEELFKTTDDRFLISTTEIPLTNLANKETIKEEKLPIRNTSLSLCFRSEAGSSGKDTNGMLRQHQFYKVELVSITTPEQSAAELEFMLNCAEDILKQLELPYRVMLLCGGDMGFSSAKTYDIEVWLPGQNTYREISSCSNCQDFQARRMNAKVKYKDNDKKIDFVHTLNGSALAVGRTLIAVLENYQNEDGSITIPKVLIPYMNGQTCIKIN